MDKKGYFAILLALGILSVLSVTSLVTQMATISRIKKTAERINAHEGFYNAELGAWHGYWREVDKIAVTSNTAILIDSEYQASLPSDLIEESTTQTAGTPLNARTTRRFSPATQIIRRYSSGAVQYAVSKASCGAASFPGSRITRKLCLSHAAAEPPYLVMGRQITSGINTVRLILIGLDRFGKRVTTFGNNGVADIDLTEFDLVLLKPGALARLRNGEVIFQSAAATGSFEFKHQIFLIHTDGTLDRAFGSNGRAKATADYFAAPFLVQSPPKVQTDGKLLLHDCMNKLKWLARLHPLGSMDDFYGIHGYLTTKSCLIERLGEPLLSSGASLRTTGGREVPTHISRYLSVESDTLDPSFGENGTATVQCKTESGTLTDQCDRVNTWLQSDAKVLALTQNSLGSGDYFLTRLTADGKLDLGFGAGGISKVTAAFANQGAIKAILPMNETHEGVDLLIAQTVNADAYVELYDHTGKAKTSFATDGVFPVGSIPTGYSHLDCSNLVIESDGKLLVGLLASNDELAVPGIARLTSDGRLDTSYGNGGFKLIPEIPLFPIDTLETTISLAIHKPD